MKFKNDKYNYNPLRKLLKDRKISINSLKKDHEVSSATIDRIKHDKPMNLSTLFWLMEELGVCDLSYIIECHGKDGGDEDQI